MSRRENRQLPKEIIPPADRNGVAATIAGTILLVILVNILAAWYLSAYTTNVGYLLIADKWRLLEHLSEPVDLLVLGDSGGNQGVDPSVFRDSLGLSAINLCTIGDATVFNDAWMLEDYLKRFGPPEGVIIVHGYDIWSRDLNMSVMAQIPGSWWRREPDMDLTLKQKIIIRLNRYIPLYSETTTLQDIIMHPGKAFSHNLALEVDGFMIKTEAYPDRVVEDGEVHREFVRADMVFVSEINQQALARIIKMAEDNRFDVYLVNGPLWDGLVTDSAFSAYFLKVQKTLGDIAATSDRVHYILKSPMLFDKMQMQSADHVAGSAAQEYTARIAAEIDSIRTGTE